MDEAGEEDPAFCSGKLCIPLEISFKLGTEDGCRIIMPNIYEKARQEVLSI